MCVWGGGRDSRAVLFGCGSLCKQGSVGVGGGQGGGGVWLCEVVVERAASCKQAVTPHTVHGTTTRSEKPRGERGHQLPGDQIGQLTADPHPPTHPHAYVCAPTHLCR